MGTKIELIYYEKNVKPRKIYLDYLMENGKVSQSSINHTITPSKIFKGGLGIDDLRILYLLKSYTCWKKFKG